MKTSINKCIAESTQEIGNYPIRNYFPEQLLRILQSSLQPIANNQLAKFIHTSLPDVGYTKLRLI